MWVYSTRVGVILATTISNMQFIFKLCKFLIGFTISNDNHLILSGIISFLMEEIIYSSLVKFGKIIFSSRKWFMHVRLSLLCTIQGSPQLKRVFVWTVTIICLVKHYSSDANFQCIGYSFIIILNYANGPLCTNFFN